MIVSDIMTKDVITVQKETALKDAAGLLAKFHIHGMPVVDEGNRVTGIITESDFFIKDSSNIYLPTFLEYIKKKNPEGIEGDLAWDGEEKKTVEDVMTNSCISILPDESIEKLIHLIKETKYKTIPVIDDQGQLSGIVTVFDIIKLL